MSKNKLAVGVKFKALRTTPSGDVTVGKTYTITEHDAEGGPDMFGFVDDRGDINFAVATGYGGSGALYHGGYEVVA